MSMMRGRREVNPLDAVKPTTDKVDYRIYVDASSKNGDGGVAVTCFKGDLLVKHILHHFPEFKDVFTLEVVAVLEGVKLANSMEATARVFSDNLDAVRVARKDKALYTETTVKGVAGILAVELERSYGKVTIEFQAERESMRHNYTDYLSRFARDNKDDAIPLTWYEWRLNQKRHNRARREGKVNAPAKP